MIARLTLGGIAMAKLDKAIKGETRPLAGKALEHRVKKLESTDRMLQDRAVALQAELKRQVYLGLENCQYAEDVRAAIRKTAEQINATRQELSQRREAIALNLKTRRNKKCQKCGGLGYTVRHCQSNDGSMSSDYSWDEKFACSCEHGKRWAESKT